VRACGLALFMTASGQSPMTRTMQHFTKRHKAEERASKSFAVVRIGVGRHSIIKSQPST
jgi:hypothetical protein